MLLCAYVTLLKKHLKKTIKDIDADNECFFLTYSKGFFFLKCSHNLLTLKPSYRYI